MSLVKNKKKKAGTIWLQVQHFTSYKSLQYHNYEIFIINYLYLKLNWLSSICLSFFEEFFNRISQPNQAALRILPSSQQVVIISTWHFGRKITLLLRMSTLCARPRWSSGWRMLKKQSPESWLIRFTPQLNSSVNETTSM